MLAAGGSDGKIRIFDMSTCSCIFSWQAHSKEVIAVQFSMDETGIISMGSDSTILLSSLHNTVGQVVTNFSYEGFVKGVNRKTRTDIAFDEHGERFLVGSKNNHGIVYQTNSPNPIGLLVGHTAPVVCCDWTSYEDQSICITGSIDKTIRITKL